jgi:hypothetical protein
MNTTFVQGQAQSPLAIQAALPHVVITGDLQIVVTESDGARGPIIGRYSIETQEMQKPLQVYWGGEGQVKDRQARATEIAFKMPGFRAGQMWIYSVQAQVTDQRTSIVTGVFVQILVTADTLPQVSASA